jgi:hypothetical protein
MVEDQPTLMAEATSDALEEKEALPKPELSTTQEPSAGTMAAFTDIQIRMWNLGEWIPIAPQVWDADTLQVRVGASEDDVDIINLDDSEITPAVPEPLKKSPKDKRKKGRKKLAQQEIDGRLVIRFKKAGSARPVDTAEADGRPGGTAGILETATIHSTEDGAVLATDVASVQEPEEPVVGTYEVRLADDRASLRDGRHADDNN